MDEQVAIVFFKQDVAWLKTELKKPVGIKTMMSALESRVYAEELAIEALTERMERGWIPMSDRLPEGNCLVYEANRRRVLFCYGDEYEAVDWNVTHWMPKPEPPVNK